MLKKWEELSMDFSLTEAMDFAKKNGFEFYFDWESCRTEEGFYRITGCIEFCIKRGRIFADMADSIWMETPTPELAVASAFAKGVHAKKPNVMLAYNLSPSFNWNAHGMKDSDLG